MKTYDEIFSIENRADPRRRMFYIVPPYTSMLEDVKIGGAEMVVSTQQTLHEDGQKAQFVLQMDLRNAGRKQSPEIDVGALASYII